MKKTSNTNTIKNLFPYLILILVIFVILNVLNMGRTITKEITTGELMTEIANKNVTEISITPSAEESIYYVEGKLSSYNENEKFKAKVVDAELNSIVKYAEANNLKVYETNADPGKVSWVYIIINILPLVILVGATYFIFVKMANTNKGSMDFGKSRAKLSEDKKNDNLYQVKMVVKLDLVMWLV